MPPKPRSDANLLITLLSFIDNSLKNYNIQGTAARATVARRAASSIRASIYGLVMTVSAREGSMKMIATTCSTKEGEFLSRRNAGDVTFTPPQQHHLAPPPHSLAPLPQTPTRAALCCTACAR